MGKDKKDRRKRKKKKEKKEKKEKEDSDSDKEDSDASGDAKGKKNTKEDGEELEYDDEEVKDVIKTLASFVEGKGGKPSVEDFFEELRMQQLAKIFDTRVRLYIALEALCGTTMDAKALSEMKKYVNKCISQGKMDAESILWGFGAYLDKNPDARRKRRRRRKKT